MSEPIERPKLTVERAGTGTKAVVFIHGILSSHETFAKMRAAFLKDKAFNEWHIAYFDYDFWQAMPQSAGQLAMALQEEFAGKVEELTLVCHSMGGLVSRLCVVAFGDKLPFLKRLIMLGTPNFGAIKPAQLGLLSQMVLRASGKLWGIFTRKTGVIDLTQVHKQFADFVQSSQGHAKNARNVEYVTMPGLYFHDERFAWDSSGNMGSRALSLMNLGAEWLVLAFPSAGVHIDRPHDGIVEATSVSLFTSEPGRWSEKTASILDPALQQPPTCAHIEHAYQNRQLTHVTLQQDDLMIDIVMGILQHGGAQAWRDQLGEDRFNYLIRLPGE
jgi:pimeloyl-ACP methyl ester carboxylesterase